MYFEQQQYEQQLVCISTYTLQNKLLHKWNQVRTKELKSSATATGFSETVCSIHERSCQLSNLCVLCWEKKQKQPQTKQKDKNKLNKNLTKANNNAPLPPKL